MSFYSAHDNTIMALLAQMGFRDWEIPQFAAYVAFELRSIDGEWRVGMYYNPNPKINAPDTCPNETSVPLLRMPSQASRVVQYKDAERGDMCFDEFKHILMSERASFNSEETWKAAGKLSGPEGKAFELKEAKEKLEKVSKKLEKMAKQQEKANNLAEKISKLENDLCG